MEPNLILLSDFRLPHYPTATLTLDRSPLAILDTTSEHSPSNVTIPVPTGLATILHNWCPAALTAFLDLDAWFSLTWTVQLPNNTALEIGRVRNQIMFGTLDASGEEWTLMLSYEVVLEGDGRGKWVPCVKESMDGEVDVRDAAMVEELGRRWVGDVVGERRWEAGKGVRHRFYVEYAAMDVWGDGIRMNPHWLYRSLDLDECTTCRRRGGGLEGSKLQRCGRCGTASYCSDVCQRGDWKVHKDVCCLGAEERGQMLKITEKGGLIAWDRERMFAAEGSGEMSANPNFGEAQLKRVWRAD